MNLYLISQSVNKRYCTYDSAVVATNSEDEARNIHPSQNEDYYEDFDEWDECNEWCAKEDVKVELIGTAAKDVSGVICTSFNAGPNNTGEPATTLFPIILPSCSGSPCLTKG